jgi:peptidoglycan/xylan/chitin deacetylase (PgdA/CDA1 family)
MELIVYEHGNRKENKIAITFDDGPNPFWTRKILDVLDEYNVKANFFVLGKWAEKHPNILKETFEKGHLIGNHTYSHPKEGIGDFEKAEEIIFRITGEHTKFIRAPYFNTMLCNNYVPAMCEEVKIIGADVFPLDWKSKSEEIEKRVGEKTQNGSIVFLHDGSHREEELKNRPSEMFKALPKIIEKLKEKFKIVRLDEFTF